MREKVQNRYTFISRNAPISSIANWRVFFLFLGGGQLFVSDFPEISLAPLFIQMSALLLAARKGKIKRYFLWLFSVWKAFRKAEHHMWTTFTFDCFKVHILKGQCHQKSKVFCQMRCCFKPRQWSANWFYSCAILKNHTVALQRRTVKM